jgi:hypothetical protein
MNGTAARFLRFGMALSGLMVLGWVLTGHAAKPAKHGIPLPTDWSHQHLIFSRPGRAEELARVSKDPRYQQQIYRREQALTLPASVADVSGAALMAQFSNQRSEFLGGGASAGPGNYPAKFSFDTTTANCGDATTPDYVVYSTGLTGSTGQASLVGFDNLYTGCSGTVPSIYWTYNTGGRIATSPVLSLDGKQVAFVETSGGAGILTMLKWKAAPGDTVGAPQTLTPVATSAYPSCTAPCMTQISLMGGGFSTDDTTSWAYYDYASDVAWVGGAAGWLHKVTGVFKGIPVEVSDGVFPIHLSTTAAWLSSPIYDSVSNNVFVGDADGFLHSVNATMGTVAKSARLDFGAGLVAPPLVDSTHQWVYVFASSDGSAACAGGVACSAVYQLSTSFTGGTAGRKITVGNSLLLGSIPNPNPLYAGAFDSSYYNSTNGTGNLYVCGNTGAVPTLYAIHITAGIPGTASSGATLATPASTAACSPLTDVPSPNPMAVQSERLLFSVQNNGVPLCASSGGCVFDLLDTPWQPSTVYSVGQRIFSRNLHVETVLTAGTSGGTAPAWTSVAGTQTTDGSVTWIDEGNLNQALTNNWQAAHSYAASNAHFIDSNGNVEVSTGVGTSGSAQPIWNTAVGGTTTDGTVTWTNAGAAGIAVLPSAGGASGMIIDNTVSSGALGTSPANTLGTSQIYFTTLGNQLCATSGGTGGCAVQASQTALK